MSKQSNAVAINNALIAMGFQEMSRLLVIAQAGCETQICTVGRAAQVWNAWNLTAGHSWTGPTYDGPDTTPDGHGGYVPCVQHWRSYPSLSEATRDYVAFLSMPRYVRSKAALMAGDLNAFVEALHADGFYTWPVDSFIDPKSGQKKAGYRQMVQGQYATAKSLLGLP